MDCYPVGIWQTFSYHTVILRFITVRLNFRARKSKSHLSVSAQSMKSVRCPLIAIYVTVLATVEAPHSSMASDPLNVKSAIYATGVNHPRLAQAAAFGSQAGS